MGSVWDDLVGGAENIYHSATHLSDWEVGGDVGHQWQNFTGWLTGRDDSKPADAGKPPNPLAASNAAAGQTLARQSGGMWNILTGGQGVLDNTPGQSPRLLGY